MKLTTFSRGSTIQYEIDSSMLEIITKYKWYLVGRGYLAASINGTMIYMHHLVIGFPITNQLVVDHIDKNPRNNKESNLRIITHSLNHLNIYKQDNNTSGYAGVYSNPKSKSNPWRAQIQLDGRQYHLGQFKTKEAARDCYQEVKRKILSGKPLY